MEIFNSDCLDTLKYIGSDSIDSLVTDPPAGISFMGKEWDSHKGGRKEWIEWMSGVMRECLRVMKPGAHGLVWAIPRTSHWTATALEESGFEVRDVITHLFGQGFPKSLDVSKAIDKAAGAIREVIGSKDVGPDHRGSNYANKANGERMVSDITIAATDSAKEWQGWGTALKPASEHWILIRKPCAEKTVAANVLKWGTGAINIDGSRVGGEPTHGSGKSQSKDPTTSFGDMGEKRVGVPNIINTRGRFPANLVLSHSEHCTDEQCDVECAIVALDEQSLAGGMHSAGKARISKRECDSKGMFSMQGDGHRLGDSGGTSRFFYCAKISSGERNAGFEGNNEKKRMSDARPNSGDMTGKFPDHDHREKSGNHHPTVKPQKLMRYLIKMITPPGGVVLDPFMGSGSTGLAAKSEGFRFIGIEKEKEYFEISRVRLGVTSPDFGI